MSEFMTMEEEESGIGVMQALSILSAHEHRDTANWKLVQEQRFKNGRLDETHIFVESFYDKASDEFEPIKMLVFEAEAIAKAYVMEEVESQLNDLRDEDDED
jgi:hypothetical protein